MGSATLRHRTNEGKCRKHMPGDYNFLTRSDVAGQFTWPGRVV